MNTSPPGGEKQEPTSLRERFRNRLIELGLPPKTHPYLENWADSFMKAKGYLSAEKAHAYFSALSRSTRIADWQFDQAIHSARILACDLLRRKWPESFDWETLSLDAKDPSPRHPDFLRESIPVDSGDSTSADPSKDGPEALKSDILNRARKVSRLTSKVVALASA